MLVVFWSPNHGQTGTTTTAINHSIVAALNTGKKVLLGHGDFKRSTLERCLLAKEIEDDSIYSDQGLNALRKLARNGRLSPNMIKDYTTPILSKSRLDLMQGSDIENIDSKDLDILHKIFLYSKDIYDYTFVDLHSGIMNDFTRKMLESADSIIVCLNQNLWLNEDFFEGDDYNSFLKDKNLIFHINNYNKKSKVNIKSFKRMFKVEDIVCTNHYDEIVESQNAGAVVDYFIKEYSSKKSEIITQLVKNIDKIIFNK